MTTAKRAPGPAAGHAFRLGVVAAVVAGLAGLGVAYWAGALTPVATVAVVALFPAYLVVVASALSVWLGFDKDATDLRPVKRRP